MSVGKNIRRIRREKDMPQEDLATKTGVSAQYICQIERGSKSPTIALLEIIADALECSIQDLLDKPETAPFHKI